MLNDKSLEDKVARSNKYDYTTIAIFIVMVMFAMALYWHFKHDYKIVIMPVVGYVLFLRLRYVLKDEQ